MSAISRWAAALNGRGVRGSGALGVRDDPLGPWRAASVERTFKALEDVAADDELGLGLRNQERRDMAVARRRLGGEPVPRRLQI